MNTEKPKDNGENKDTHAHGENNEKIRCKRTSGGVLQQNYKFFDTIENTVYFIIASIVYLHLNYKIKYNINIQHPRLNSMK